MKRIEYLLFVFLMFATSNYVLCQQFDSAAYNGIIAEIKALDSGELRIPVLTQILEDTLCIYNKGVEIMDNKNTIATARADQSKKDARAKIEKLNNERIKCFNSLVENWLQYSYPIEFRTEDFQFIKSDLSKVDKDNQIGRALMDVENKLLDSIASLQDQIPGSDGGGDENIMAKLGKIAFTWILPIFLLIGLLIALTGYILKSLKMKRQKSNFQNKKLQMDNQIFSLEKELNRMKITTNNPGNLASPSEPYLLSNPVISSDISPSFFAETFVSAGPRKLYTDDKSEGDIDLGEDIAGFLVGGNYSAFWVLDGTSGQDKLSSIEDRVNLGDRGEEYFSSRLLAQNIAWNLHSLIKKYGFQNSSFLLLKEAIKLTEVDWQQKIEGLSAPEIHQLKELLVERNMLICSTTIAFGILSMNRELDVTISGDCIVVTQPKQINSAKNNRRQSANLYIENDKIIVDFNEIKKDNCLVITESNIDKVVAMSDGISKTTQKWISSNVNIDFTNPKIRESLARLKQKTQDDKSITIIQIM